AASGEMHFGHETVVAAKTQSGGVVGAGVKEIAEAVEDKRFAVELDALSHMGVVADDEIDAFFFSGKFPPIVTLPVVGHDMPFDPIVDGEDAIVGRESE